MTFQEAENAIDRYLKRESGRSFLVNVQSAKDLEAVTIRYRVTGNTFLFASEDIFCKQDQLPNTDVLKDKLQHEEGNFFVREFSTFWMLQGRKILEEKLIELLSLPIAGHAVIITYQCEDYFNQIHEIKSDPRNKENICMVQGDAKQKPWIYFVTEEIAEYMGDKAVTGVNHIASAVEEEKEELINVVTKKTRENYPDSLYSITEIKSAYDMLCQMESDANRWDEKIGSAQDWQYVYGGVQTFGSLKAFLQEKFSNCQRLDTAISGYEQHKTDEHWLWLYFASVKMFGAGDDRVLNRAAQEADSTQEFIRKIYHSIFEISPQDKEFSEIYQRRKEILRLIGTQDGVADFCKRVEVKGKEAINYLTDNTTQEKELIFRILDRYYKDYVEELSNNPQTIVEALDRVYPDLSAYLLMYPFGNKLLDSYFSAYKIQKVLNHVFPEFLDVVEEQAKKREYYKILPSRSEMCDSIKKRTQEKDSLTWERTQTYFVDAMGVEYLGFIQHKCQELGIETVITVCRCELPSITEKNKEFFDMFVTKDFEIISEKRIDEIKHQGAEGYEYNKNDKKYPYYLGRELEIIADLLEKIRTKLINDDYAKAILVADHGASRLAVLAGQNSLVSMSGRGEHAGRCCLKNETDQKPENAVDADTHWVFANYDRFKGGRKASVEVHGGATLEEVVVPIIELTLADKTLEVSISPTEGGSSSDQPVVFLGQKVTEIPIYLSQRRENVRIEIDGRSFLAELQGDGYHKYVAKINKSEHKLKEREYEVKVYAGKNLLKTLPVKLKNKAENTGFSNNDMGI